MSNIPAEPEMLLPTQDRIMFTYERNGRSAATARMPMAWAGPRVYDNHVQHGHLFQGNYLE